MRLLIDINVVLDVVLARAPWHVPAAELLTAVEEGRAEGWVAAHTVTTVHYLVRRARDRAAADQAAADLLRIVDVVPLDDADFQQALILGFTDFEDAVQAAAAMRIGANAIVTRNEPDFRTSPIPPFSPPAMLALLR